MRKNNANLRRLALKGETVRTLRARELIDISAGWECSAKGSGNIKCTPNADDDGIVREPQS